MPALAGRSGRLGVPLAGTLDVPADVVIDFSIPGRDDGDLANVPRAKDSAGRGDDRAWSRSNRPSCSKRREKIPLLWSPSMSLAVNLAMKLSQWPPGARKIIRAGADVEIIERHHRFKEDAPSGTALKFGEIIAERDGTNGMRSMAAKAGPANGRTARSAITPCACGDNPGEHTIIFGLLGETLEMSVSATNRDCYAHGALAAAKFLGRPSPACTA